MVPKIGLEPTLPKELAPHASASTNSATWASIHTAFMLKLCLEQQNEYQEL